MNRNTFRTGCSKAFSAGCFWESFDASLRYLLGRAFSFTFFLLLLPGVAGAATYYVDSRAGNDANSGLSASSAWQTIAKVNSSTFKPGDSILFESGDIWREQLIVPSSGAAGNPITFGAYGAGAKPVISGANVIAAANWKLYKGNIYVANVGKITAPSQLYVDGTYYDPAHYPQSGWLTATANSTDNVSIIDTNLALPASQIVGATIKVKAVSYSITTLTATAFAPLSSKITVGSQVFSDSSIYMQSGCGFYLQNQLWMLSSPGEWCYDASAGNLYLWTAGGDSPALHSVEVTSRPYGVSVNGRSYISIQNIAINNADQNDFYAVGVSSSNTANSITASNLDIRGGRVGIFFDQNTSAATISNCSVLNTISTGIIALCYTSNVNITYNSVNNAGNVGACANTSLAGIYSESHSVNISNNTVSNSGYIGIRGDGIGTGNTVIIANNTVNESCLALSDCGGIYTYGRKTGTTSKIINGNRITNSIGNVSGTPYSTTGGYGIYLDDGTYNTTVANNTISNTDFGIYIHDGHNNSVTGNAVYAGRQKAIYLYEDSGASSLGYVKNNTISNNLFETLSSLVPAQYSSSVNNTTANFGTYNNNLYCHPNTTFAITSQQTNYTLQSWQHATGQDLNSTDTASNCDNSTAPKLLAPTGLTVGR